MSHNKDLKLPVIKKFSTLEERVPDLNPEEANFIRKCLQFNHTKRSTAKELLKDTYLKNIPKDDL